MSARAIIAIISICAVVTGGFLGTMFSMLTIEEVDRKREYSSLDSSFPFVRWANLQTLREYRNSCPNGKLHIYTLACYALAAIGFIGFAVFMVIAYQPLVVRVTSPAEGATFTAPANIVISADASEGNYSVSRVDFYQGATLIGSSTTAPYSVTWSDVRRGNFSLTAKAFDDRGTTTTSDAVSITVNATGNIPSSGLSSFR
jgi:hypothetical protein